MRILIILLFLLTSCMSSKKVDTSSFNENNLYDLSIEEYKEFKNNFSAPLLANITEFGKTPLFTQKELSDVGVDMVLYPLTAFRAMSLSAEKIYNSIIKDGTQEPLLDIMQTREELYEVLDYYNFEKQLDEQFENTKKEGS